MSDLEVVALPNGQFAENCYLVAERRTGEAVMIDPAAVLTRPVPLPVTPAKAPVPPTIVWVISKKIGAFAPAFVELPGEIVFTMLSWTIIVLPSSNVIVRT